MNYQSLTNSNDIYIPHACQTYLQETAEAYIKTTEQGKKSKLYPLVMSPSEKPHHKAS